MILEYQWQPYLFEPLEDVVLAGDKDVSGYEELADECFFNAAMYALCKSRVHWKFGSGDSPIKQNLPLR